MTRFEQFQQNVQRWATERGIYEHSTALAQALKAVSEVGELCDAVIKHQRAEAQDAVGDVAVCVVNVAHFLSHTFDPDHFDPDNLLSHDHFRAAAEAARVVSTLSHQVATMCNMMEAFVNDGCDRAITALREFCVCRGLDFDDCCESAWQTIKDRKGRMVAGGAFVKEGE